MKHPGRGISPARIVATKELHVITLGIILLLVGFLIHIGFLWTIGIILLVVGLILALLGATDRAVFGRRHYY